MNMEFIEIPTVHYGMIVVNISHIIGVFPRDKETCVLYVTLIEPMTGIICGLPYKDVRNWITEHINKNAHSCHQLQH